MPGCMLSQSYPLADLLVRSADQHPDRVAEVFPDTQRTFAELLEAAVTVARGLHALGIRRGDHVGLLMPNSQEYIESYFGVALLGGVLVPMNARYRSAEVAYVVSHAELAAVLTTDSFRDRLNFRAIINDALPSLADSRTAEPLALQEASHLRRVIMLRGAGSAGVLGQQEFLQASSTVPAGTVELLRQRVRVRDVAMILYTSGTTARPKGCMITHEAITRGSLGRFEESVPDHDAAHVIWCCGPLFHIGAMQSMLAAIGHGHTFLTDVHLDGARALTLIKEWKATSIWPWFMASFNAVLDLPGFDPRELPHVSSIILGGTPSDLMRVQEIFPGVALINGGGMSEMTGWYSTTRGDDTRELRAYANGRVVSGAEAMVIDPESGQEAPRGELGELLLRGPSEMLGYFRDPEATAKTVDGDGWIHTGDLFRQLESDHLVFEGRLKDMLRVGGENVPPLEVEAFLCEHPGVLSAQVVGRADPRLDEVPVAFVELVAGASLTESDLIEHCRGRIASFKVPREIFFVRDGDWPMSATKVNKVALRQMAAERERV